MHQSIIMNIGTLSLVFALVFLSSCHAWSIHGKEQHRRAILGWIGDAAVATAVATTTVVILPPTTTSVCNAADMDVEDFIKSGRVAMPMGVSGQAGKSRPETGVVLRDGSDISRDTRTGDVLAELVVKGTDGDNTAVLASFSSPWPLATGSVFDVECRDSSTGDGAFLSVTQNVGGKSIDQVKDSFILDNLLKSDGRFSFYGPPTDVKVKSSSLTADGTYKIMDLSFSTISQATQTEIPRRARLAATVPSGADQAIVLVASSSAIRWKKGSEQTIASTINTFRAIPAPQSSMKIRAKPRRDEL